MVLCRFMSFDTKAQKWATILTKDCDTKLVQKRHKTEWFLDYFGFVSDTSKNQETNFYLLAEEKIQIEL
jgi:hypothetical protein